MRFIAALFVFIFCVAPAAQAADQSQAREVARMNNCPPKKIEVYQQTLGTTGNTVYRIECNMPKAKDESAKASNAMLVRCDENICQMLRALPPDSK